MGRRSTEHYWIILWSGVGRIIFFWMWIRPERWWSTSEGRRGITTPVCPGTGCWCDGGAQSTRASTSTAGWTGIQTEKLCTKKGGWTGSTPKGSWDPSVCAGKRWRFSFFTSELCWVQCTLLRHQRKLSLCLWLAPNWTPLKLVKNVSHHVTTVCTTHWTGSLL